MRHRPTCVRGKVDDVDFQFTDRVRNGGNAINQGCVTVEKHNWCASKANQTAGKPSGRHLHRAFAHNEPEHAACSDELIEKRSCLHAASIEAISACR